MCLIYGEHAEFIVNIQSRNLNFATFVGANIFIAPAEVAKFKLRDCIYTKTRPKVSRCGRRQDSQDLVD